MTTNDKFFKLNTQEQTSKILTKGREKNKDYDFTIFRTSKKVFHERIFIPYIFQRLIFALPKKSRAFSDQ